MRVLVTGGTGFIGSNIVQALLKEGHEVLITGHDAEQKIPGFDGKYLQTGLLGIDWDAIGEIDVLFHQAAINETTLKDRVEMMRHNLEASKTLFGHVVAKGCTRIVYASSTAGYGDAPAPYKEDGPMNPLNPYGESKKLLDEYAMEFAEKHPDVIVVGLRYCNVYGPGEQHKGKRASIIRQLAQQMTHCNPRVFKYGEQKRDYIYVKDVVLANLLAAKAPKSCVVNCGGGTATTFNQLIAIINYVLGTERKPEYIDNPYEAMYQNHTECDMSAAKEKIGFIPKYDLRAGIKDYHETGQLVPK
jgi:ADP-L-glycero-D-manno-heptose 6-epimerase